jgi:hypothetical protein
MTIEIQVHATLMNTEDLALNPVQGQPNSL